MIRRRALLALGSVVLFSVTAFGVIKPTPASIPVAALAATSSPTTFTPTPTPDPQASVLAASRASRDLHRAALVHKANLAARAAAHKAAVNHAVYQANLAAIARHRATQAASRTRDTSSSGIPAVWIRLGQCESGGDIHYGGPGGHTDPGYGMFEGWFNDLNSTWLAYGGAQYAQHAWGATRYQQLVINRRVLAAEGPNAWPVCSRIAGLQRGD